MARPILLFKEPTQEDIYETTFKSHGYTAKCVPVLSTVHANLDQLRDVVLNATELGIRGAVITSKRSCESLAEALSVPLPKNPDTTSLSAGPLLEHWTHLPIYVVGEATASAVRKVQQRFHGIGLSSVRILGEESGTGEHLGHFIVKHHAANGGGKLLYLAGDKNRDTVASILTEGRIPFQALRVYETQRRSDFESLLAEAVESLRNSSSSDIWWAAFFAPSTADFALPVAQNLLSSKNITFRTATIGPVTTSHIEKVLKASVEVTATRPDAPALVEAIQRYDRDS